MHYFELFLFFCLSTPVSLALPHGISNFVNKAPQRNFFRIVRGSGYTLFYHRKPFYSSTLLSSSCPTESKETSNIEVEAEGRESFAQFYEATVSFGSPMSLDQFLMHQRVELMLAQRLLDTDDISDVWISLWGCNCKCLTEEEAFQTLCAVYDLKMISS